MSTTALHSTDSEEALAAFLQSFDEPLDVTARTLAHAWSGGGGRLNVGKVTTRLVAGDEPFTAGTIYAPKDGPGRLELSRIILEHHGLGPDAWTQWASDFADLAHHGFDAEAKYPSIPITASITATELVQLVQGLRDLARLLA